MVSNLLLEYRLANNTVDNTFITERTIIHTYRAMVKQCFNKY